MKLSTVIICLLLINTSAFSQNLGRYTLEEWQTVIDTTWDDNLTTEDKLKIFDDEYDLIDWKFSCFQGLPNNILDSLRQIYRPEIEAGVSHGRFVAIMNHFVMALKEGHTWIINHEVNFNTPLEPGVPLFVLGGLMDNSHFGATLTPLPDSSLLVIKALDNHPLGLQPGDIVLGYDGIEWKILYKAILNAQFPVFGMMPPLTAEKAYTHDMLKSAGMNWHLFDTLDVVKYSSGDTMHYPTAHLGGQSGDIGGNEQLKIPGVPFPDFSWEDVKNYFADFIYLGDYVGWGIVEGTNIGYIYVYAWCSPYGAPGSDISEEFYQAVNNLMNIYKVDGLIFDGRHNFGGQFNVHDKGFSLLFNSYIETIGFDTRSNPNDHFLMHSHPEYPISIIAIKGEPSTFFDRPIAMLTGPAAISMGDVVPFNMTFHPMVRTFGKSTSGAFSTTYWFDPNPGWTAGITDGNAFLASNPGNYLSRAESHVDEEVWLTQEDVAKGEDTVVKRAIEWINNLAYAHDVAVNKTYAVPGNDSVLITTQVENLNQHELSITAYINNMNGVAIDSLTLFDDGDHGDGAANDNLWGNFYLTPTGEQSYKISVTTNDLTEETSRTLPNVAWFTTIGQVVFDHFEFTSTDTIPNPGDRIRIRIFLRNDGFVETASNITAKLSSPDTSVTVNTIAYLRYGDIRAGEINESSSGYLISFKGPFDKSIYQVPFTLDVRSNDYSFWVDTTLSIPVDIEQKEKLIPEDFSLFQNYPNPFNPKTVIRYSLPVTSHLELAIYNILGQKVATLVNKKQAAGSYRVQWDASGFTTGIYIYQLKAKGKKENAVFTKKLVLLK